MRIVRIFCGLIFSICVLSLNGCASSNKLSISELPSEDTTALTEVRWQDRSAEVLQIFAENGKWLAISELCYRYTKEKDIEQSKIWCKKASIENVKIYEFDPSPPPKHEFLYSMEAGMLSERFFRFDSSMSRRVKIRLSNPKLDPQWRPWLALCLEGLNSIDTACLRVTLDAANADKISFKTYRYKINEKYGVQEINSSHGLGDVIELTFYLRDRKLHFIIDGKDDMVQDIGFSVGELSLYCGTGDCAFDFARSPQS